MKQVPKLILLVLFLLATNSFFAQHKIDIDAVVNTANQTMHMEQKVVYKNNSDQKLFQLYFHDWNNSYKSTVSPLGKRFSEDFIRRFHFAKEEDRGATVINSVKNIDGQSLTYSRPVDAPDILIVELNKALEPGEEVELSFSYDLILPSDKFTGHGYDKKGNFLLQYWFLTPAVYEKEWKAYSNKNLDDLYAPKMDLDIELAMPLGYHVVSPLEMVEEKQLEQQQIVKLEGNNVLTPEVHLLQEVDHFERIVTDDLSLITNLESPGLNMTMKHAAISRIFKFLKNKLGAYPHESLMVTQEDYKSNPVYGLNQLPEFIRPFSDGFQYDIKQLKVITDNYLENTLLINPRKDQWIHDAIQIKLMMEYVDTYYPDIHILGNFSDFYLVEWTHASDLKFNDQYPLLYLHMARENLDQALTTPLDSLLKFNKNIANPYKAGVGLSYLEDFTSEYAVSQAIKELYQEYLLKPVRPEDFERVLKKNTEKDIDWFFKDYVASGSKIDFVIEKVVETEDSLIVSIKNKRKNYMPVSLYGIKDEKIVFKKWIENVNPIRTVVIPKMDIDRLALNYELIIPEINARNNFEAINSVFDRPLQFRLFKDVEDSRFSQVFFMPEIDYNLYDGAVVGASIYNQTFLERNFNYSLSPKWAFNSNTIVGSASFYNTFHFDNQSLASISLGAGGSRYSYGYGLFYHAFSPFLRFNFRNNNLRDNERQSLSISSVNIYRDVDVESTIEEPNYNVLSVEYNYSNPNLVNYLKTNTDFQLAKSFSKVSFSVDYRKLFPSNRQINLRFFAGAFIFNDKTDSDFFSFALDRPTDYLFEYNYYGRSESSGLFSQQIIMAEGGFKSQLQPEYANQWITTVNASTNIWKWIYAYGDVGLVKNKDIDAKFLYDSGIRVSLIADYFEVFFPVYSSLGWEIDAENYDQRIRFIVTLSLSTVTRLFSRRWY